MTNLEAVLGRATLGLGHDQLSPQFGQLGLQAAQMAGGGLILLGPETWTTLFEPLEIKAIQSSNAAPPVLGLSI